MFIADTDHGKGLCSFEKNLTTPTYLFCPNNVNCKFKGKY